MSPANTNPDQKRRRNELLHNHARDGRVYLNGNALSENEIRSMTTIGIDFKIKINMVKSFFFQLFYCPLDFHPFPIIRKGL